VPAAGHPVPLPRGGAIERLGRARTPVDKQLIVIVAAQAQPADVEPVVVVEVKAAEAQVPLRGVKLRAAVLIQLSERLALRPPLEVLDALTKAHRGEPLPRGRPRRVKPLVEHRHIRLLSRELARAI